MTGTSVNEAMNVTDARFEEILAKKEILAPWREYCDNEKPAGVMLADMVTLAQADGTIIDTEIHALIAHAAIRAAIAHYGSSPLSALMEVMMGVKPE